MASEEASVIVSLSVALYRLLLVLYPRAHRREYGPLMLQAFRDLCRDAWRQGGTAAVIALWCHTLIDLGATAAREHLHELRDGGWFEMWRHALGRALLYALTYVGLLLPSFVAVALAWHWLVASVLFHCSDGGPIIDFLPPFVHPQWTGDHYIAPAAIVYLVWYAFLVAVFLAPALVIWQNQKRRLRARQGPAAAAGVARSLLPSLVAAGMLWLVISLFWNHRTMLAVGLGRLPGLMTLLQGPGQALCIAWLALSAIIAGACACDGRPLPPWVPAGVGALLGLTIGGPLYFLMGLPALAAALISLLAQPRERRRIPWPVWLGLPAVVGILLAPPAEMNRLWGLTETRLALLAAGGSLHLGRRFGRRAGLPALALGVLLWQLPLDHVYSGPWLVPLPDGFLLPFAILLLVALPVWLLCILPPAEPVEPEGLQETRDG